jgi:glycosyltransferase involved in cell wall biosynthesis
LTADGLPESLRSLRVALVHDYLNQQGGAESVVAVFTEMFPGAPLYTSVYDMERMPERWRHIDIRTSFMQRLSPRVQIARALLPLYPTAFESFTFDSYDLVLSSTTTFAKGIITRPETCHVCYCNNPTRFLWMYREYVRHERLPPGGRALLPWLATAMRPWDYAAAQRVDYFVAGSFNAARRIAKYYRRESVVLQAPIDIEGFKIAPEHGEYFLIVSRLQPYKRLDLAILACSQLGLPLHVVGDGPDRVRLQKLAGPTVRFFGRLSPEQLSDHMARCRALIWPGEEDFGLVPLEVQASGRPVIAYRGGGALETVVEGVTGIFFDEPSVPSLIAALRRFRDVFDPLVLRNHARAFDRSIFKRRLYDLLVEKVAHHRRQLSNGQGAW